MQCEAIKYAMSLALTDSRFQVSPESMLQFVLHQTGESKKLTIIMTLLRVHTHTHSHTHHNFSLIPSHTHTHTHIALISNHMGV